MFSGFDFLVLTSVLTLCLLPNKIDFALSSPKLILNLLSTKFLFSVDSISVISLC